MLALALCPFLSCTTHPPARTVADPALPCVFLLDGKQLQATRQRIQAGDKTLSPALARLQQEARAALKAGPFSVMDKQSTPPSGDRHDYMSEAPYFWPNPDTTNGLPYIRRDGERNPEIHRISDHRRQDEMADAVQTLALAYYFLGEEACAARAASLVRTWFLAPATRMNPHLQYAQAVRGVNTGRGIGLIETRSLVRVVDAVGLLDGSPSWTGADQQGLRQWFTEFLLWMQTSKNGREEAAAKNNHGTYYDVQVVSFALFLGNTELATEVVQTARQKRIAVQIEPDGRQPLELVRTKAWGYSVGNLGGLMLLARLGETVGVDLWRHETPDGRSLRKALDYLAPFAIGDAKWPHAQIGVWPPEMLFSLLRQAAVKMPDARDAQWLAKIPSLDEADRSRLLGGT
jgi:hypothetical protein